MNNPEHGIYIQSYNEEEKHHSNNGVVAHQPNLPVPSEEDLKQVHPSVNPGNARKMLGNRRRRKEDSLFETICSWIVEHQVGLALNLIALLYLTHACFPRVRPQTRTFFRLSYYDPVTSTYGRGPEDLYFVAYWIVIFTGLRAGVMSYLLLPAAERCGLKSKKSKARFAEQGWVVIYDGLSSSIGLYIMYNSPYWLNLKELWAGWPHIQIDGLMKWYYLVQFAFWLQQIVVVNIEERRKDHWQMFTHHIITCALLFCSYGYYQTRVGNVILFLMDIVDIFLASAKVLKYCGFQRVCDAMFGLFILSWFLFRHVLYNLVCYSIYRDVPTAMPNGRYSSLRSGTLLSSSLAHTSDDARGNGPGHEVLYSVLQPYFRPGGEFFFNDKIKYTFMLLLGLLQALCMVWFVMIVRVAAKVVAGKGADDTRSDDEGEADEEDEDGDIYFEDDEVEAKKSANVPVFVSEAKRRTIPPQSAYLMENRQGGNVGGGVGGVRRRPSPMSKVSKRKTGAGGAASLADRKDLLGRIGCDKPT